MKKINVEEQYFVSDDEGNTLIKDKVDFTDEISLVRYNNTVNKKQVKILLFCFASLCVLGMLIGLSTAEQSARTAKRGEENQYYKPEIPNYLRITPDDYVVPEETNDVGQTGTNTNIIVGENNGQSGLTKNNIEQSQDFYNSYTRDTEKNQLREQSKQTDLTPKISVDNSENTYAQGSQESHSKKKSLFVTMEISDSNTPPENTQVNQNFQTPQNTDQTQLALRALEMQTTTSDYQTQNMQKENNSFLEEKRKNAASDGLKTDFSYTKYPHSTISATTMIPITLITGINSDLPGEIIGQVTRDIYDSMSGNYLLIPKGSRVIGSYSSSVAFGQERALIAWEQLKRTDGVTISFNGFQGTNLKGYAGFNDKVDNHFDSLASALGISTGVNLLYNTFVTLISTVDYLNKLAALSGAQDNAKQGYEALDKIIEKIANRQPTLIIREGYAGYVLVSSDLFLPPLYYYNAQEYTTVNQGYY